MGEGDAEGETEKVIAGLEGEIKNVFGYLTQTVDTGKSTLGEALAAVEKIKVE